MFSDVAAAVASQWGGCSLYLSKEADVVYRRTSACVNPAAASKIGTNRVLLLSTSRMVLDDTNTHTLSVSRAMCLSHLDNSSESAFWLHYYFWIHSKESLVVRAPRHVPAVKTAKVSSCVCVLFVAAMPAVVKVGFIAILRVEYNARHGFLNAAGVCAARTAFYFTH